MPPDAPTAPLGSEAADAPDLLHNHKTHPTAFPRLTNEQLATLEPLATCSRFDAGDYLFHEGDPDIGFFVLADGTMDIVQEKKGGTRGLVATHQCGEFTGEISVVTGQPAVVSGVATSPIKVLHLTRQALQKVIATQPDVGNVILTALMQRREILESRGYATVTLVGSRWSRETFALKDFLARNRVLYRWDDPDTSPDVDAFLQGLGLGPSDLPVVVCDAHGVLRKPTIPELAKALKLSAGVDGDVFDLVVVGGGPAGLAAAVYGASEGLSTLVVEAVAPGGQAGTSSRIENYLGFPTGVSGADLAAAAVMQARKFGATVTASGKAVRLECDGYYKRLGLEDGQTPLARTVVLATGAAYRKLSAENYEKYEQSGIYYGATHVEAVHCNGEEVVVVGGGNSAGQAAVFLSQQARHVHLLIRGESLSSSMSRYLIDRIESSPRITLRPRCEITKFGGDDRLRRVTVRCRDSGEPFDLDVVAVFVMIGADPRTDWLDGCVGLDGRGFIVTGADAARHPSFDRTRVGRDPFLLETTTPGIFAVGDVRSGSVKRVAGAVGEGSMAVKYVHEILNA